MINLYRELSNDYEEVKPLDFYRDIFKNHLDKKDEFNKGAFVGIASEFCGTKKANGKELVKRYSITDDLDVIKELLKSENFVITSPIGYIGKSRKSENARVMYAFTIEIDGILRNDDGKAVGYNDLKFQMKNKVLPTPNYFVASGNGLHLYYIFDEPLLLFPNVVKSLKAFKEYITPFFWNRYVTKLYKKEDIQFESIFQGFRLVGGVTKNKDRVKVFKVREEPCSVSELNSYVPRVENHIQTSYKSNMRLSEAKKRYPKWYKERIEQKRPKGSWIVKRDLYDWWLRRIKEEKNVGHRYYCVMLLCIYAIKCNISRDELESDAFGLIENFDNISESEDNRFTEKDVFDALQVFEDKGMVTYPINSIVALSGMNIEKNKRNYQKQEWHLEDIRFKKMNMKKRGQEFKNPEGRPLGSKDKKTRKNKGDIVRVWRKDNPNGTKAECNRAIGLDPKTIRKYW